MNCHCCGITYELNNSYKGAKRQEVVFLQCPNCGHGYHKYEGCITEYHKNEYRGGDKNTIKGIRSLNEIVDGVILPRKFHASRKWITLGRIDLIKDIITKDSEVLDVGSGGCSFAKVLRYQVKDVECTEVDHVGIKECKRLGFTTFYSLDINSLKTGKQYDIVTSWHVLEHIEDVEGFMNKLYDLTKDFIVLEVPTNRSIPRIFNGHLHYFTENSIANLCYKFKIIEIKEGVQKPSIFIKLSKNK